MQLGRLKPHSGNAPGGRPSATTSDLFSACTLRHWLIQHRIGSSAACRRPQRRCSALHKHANHRTVRLYIVIFGVLLRRRRAWRRTHTARGGCNQELEDTSAMPKDLLH